jgi:hypothetical protein
MPTNSFTVLANARLATQSRVYLNSCCPDKDLVILFSRLGGNDRMSLWNINQGTKKWETDIGDSEASLTAVAMAWSPDGNVFFFGETSLEKSFFLELRPRTEHCCCPWASQHSRLFYPRRTPHSCALRPTRWTNVNVMRSVVVYR